MASCSKNSGIKNETLQMLMSFNIAKFKIIAEAEEEKKRLITAQIMLDLHENEITAVQPECLYTNGSILMYLLQNDSSHTRSVSESPRSSIDDEVFEIPVEEMKWDFEINRGTAETTSTNGFSPRDCQEWIDISKVYTDFKNAVVNEREMNIILRFVTRDPNFPCPELSEKTTIELSDVYETIMRNNVLINRRVTKYFHCFYKTGEWNISKKIKELNKKMM